MSRIKPAAECVEKYHSISKAKKDYFELVLILKNLVHLTECPRKRQKVSEMKNHGF